MFNVRKTFVLLVLLLPLHANAECIAPTACDNVKIENLYITDNGDIYVNTSGTESNLNCSDTSNGKYLTLKTTGSKNYKEIYAALLAARTTDKPMKINIHKGSLDCSIERVEYGINF